MGEPSAQVVDTGHGSDEQRQKKGGRECRPSTRGRMRRRCWRPSHTTLFNQPAVPWASFTNCQKKGGCSLSTPAFDASPLHRRSTQMMTRGSATGRRHDDKTKGVVSTQEKARVPAPLRVIALIWAIWYRPLRQLCFNRGHYRSTPHHNLHGVRTACVVYLLACFSHRNGFPRNILMRSTSGRLALEHRFASTVLWSLFAALVLQALANK